MAGGASPYRKGRRIEYLVRDHLADHGWVVIRAYASKGPWDLLAMRQGPVCPQLLLVQVKGGSDPYIGPGARGKLSKLAQAAGAVPVLASYDRGRYGFRVITSGPPRTWLPLSVETG